MGVQMVNLKIQNLKRGSENLSPMRADRRSAPHHVAERQTLGGSGVLLILLLHDDWKLHF
jgi:hypothetical protein